MNLALLTSPGAGPSNLGGDAKLAAKHKQLLSVADEVRGAQPAEMILKSWPVEYLMSCKKTTPPSPARLAVASVLAWAAPAPTSCTVCRSCGRAG